MTIFKDFVQLICVTSVFQFMRFIEKMVIDFISLPMKTVCSGWNSDKFCASFNGKIQFNLKIIDFKSIFENLKLRLSGKNHRRLIKMNVQPFIWHSLIPK